MLKSDWAVDATDNHVGTPAGTGHEWPELDQLERMRNEYSPRRAQNQGHVTSCSLAGGNVVRQLNTRLKKWDNFGNNSVILSAPRMSPLLRSDIVRDITSCPQQQVHAVAEGRVVEHITG